MQSKTFQVCQSKRRLSLITTQQLMIETVEQEFRLLSVERNAESNACESSFLQPQNLRKTRRDDFERSLNEHKRSNNRSHTPIGSLTGNQNTTYVFFKKLRNGSANAPFVRTVNNGIFARQEDQDPNKGKF